MRRLVFLLLLSGGLPFFSIHYPLKADDTPSVSYKWGDGWVRLTLEDVYFTAGQNLVVQVKIENQGSFDLYYSPYHFWVEGGNLVERQSPVSTNDPARTGFLAAEESTSINMTFALPPGQTELRLVYKPIAFLDEEAVLPIGQPSVVAPPAPSPDLTSPPDYKNKILFWSDRPEGIGIYSMNPDGSNQTLIDDFDAYYEALETDHYSPDGCNKLFVRQVCGPKQICFFGALRDEYHRDLQIWAHNSRTGQDFAVVGAVLGADYDPVWSPDDDHVAFVSQQEQNDEIHIYEFSINWDRRLTESPQLDKHPTFSPDGTNIAFWSDRTGQRQIWVMDLNGENQRNISNNAHNDWKPVWWKPRPICQPQ
jgi:hypothetical protein